MKNLKLMFMLIAAGSLLITASCKKKEIQDLEDQITQLEADKTHLEADKTQLETDKTGLTDELNGAHGKLVLDHSVDGRDSAVFSAGEFWVWFNETGTPASTTSGYDLGPVAGSISSYTPNEVTFTVMGMPIGEHYIYSVCTVTVDTTGTPVTFTVSGGKNFAIENDHECPSLHLHGE